MAFDLTKLAKKDTTELHLVNPVTEELLFDEDGKAVKIILFGTSSKQYRDAQNTMLNSRLKRGKKTQVNAEMIEEEALDLLVACSDKAVNLEYEGKEISGEVFRDLYSDPRFDWLRAQVDAAITNAGNFIAA